MFSFSFSSGIISDVLSGEGDLRSCWGDGVGRGLLGKKEYFRSYSAEMIFDILVSIEGFFCSDSLGTVIDNLSGEGGRVGWGDAMGCPLASNLMRKVRGRGVG